MSDEVDRAIMQKPAIAAKKPGLGSAIKRPAASIRSAGGTNSGTSKKKQSQTKYEYNYFFYAAGGMDEQTFVKSFEDVPTVQIYSPREISEEMKNILQTISDLNKDWNKRVDAVSNS